MAITDTGEDAATSEAPRPPGRPRDTAIDGRILNAARTVYAQRGWTGFNFEGVAKTAKVSKDAVHRRFDSPLELLIASWREIEDDHHQHELALEAEPDIHTYLLAVAMDHFEMYTSVDGFDYLRLYVEAKRLPRQLTVFNNDRSRENVGRVRSIVRAAIAAGELPHLETPTALLDAIVGGVAIHVMVTPPPLRSKMLAEAPDYLATLVDMALRGSGYRRRTSPKSTPA